jgi:hypothetical protein
MPEWWKPCCRDAGEVVEYRPGRTIARGGGLADQGIAKGACMRRMAEERHNVAFMVGIILGGLGGALATLFLTPLSGARTREQLRARLAALQPGPGIPDHLDSGTYATTGDGGADAAGAAGAGGTAGGVLNTLRERVQGVTAPDGPLAAVREKVQGLTGGERDERGEVPVGGTATFSPVNERAHQGMERLEDAEERAEVTAPPPGRGA